MVPSGDLLTSASDSKENPCGTLPSILPDHGRRCHTVSTGDKQGISVAVQIVANDLQPNFVTANQAGIDYQLTRIPGFGDIEGQPGPPLRGGQTASTWPPAVRTRPLPRPFVADAAKDMTFAASVAGSRPPHHGGHVPAVLDQAVRTG